MFDNTVIIQNIKNYKFNFKKILKKNDTIIWKNCDNLNIKINSKINKLIFINCFNIKIKVYDLISGIDVEKSQVNISYTNLKLINTYKSIVIIKYKNNNLPQIINELSNIKYIQNIQDF